MTAEFITLQIGIIAIVLFLFYLLSMFWPPDSPWAPWWKTSEKVALVIGKLAKITKKDTVYELGSGDGTMLITVAQKYGARGVGIEIDPLRFYQSKIRAKRHGVSNKIQFLKKNFFSVNFSGATVVFVYLVPKALKKLRPKFFKELKPGTRVVSYRYKIDYLPQVGFNKTHKIYLYKIPKQ